MQRISGKGRLGNGVVCYQGKKRGPNPTEQREKQRTLVVYEYPPGSQAEAMARMREAPAEPEGLGIPLHSHAQHSSSSVPCSLQHWLLCPAVCGAARTLTEGQQEPGICIQAFHGNGLTKACSFLQPGLNPRMLQGVSRLERCLVFDGVTTSQIHPTPPGSPHTGQSFC